MDNKKLSKSRYCASYGCSNAKFKANCREKSFFKFPLNDRKLLEIWLQKIRRQNFIPSPYSVLCSDHFQESCFAYQNFTNRRSLKENSVPTIFSFSKPQNGKKILDLSVTSLTDNIADTNDQEELLIDTKKTKKTKDSEDKKLHPTKPAELCNENNGFVIKGTRIVNIDYFIRQLMQLNDHGPPGCSLSYMNIISETRTGVASELKFKCSMCNLEKCIWTEDISRQSPMVLTARVTENGNGFSALGEFLDTLNVPVSINASAAEPEKVKKKNNENVVQKTFGKKEQLVSKQEDTDTERFTVIVNGKRAKSNHGTSSQANIEKRTEVCPRPEPDFIFGLKSNLPTRTKTPAVMTVELDPRTFIVPDADVPFLLEPGPSSQIESDFSMMEEDVNLAMTGEIYRAEAPQSHSFSKFKEDPTVPDSERVVQELNNFSKEPSSTTDRKGSLFQPPVLIKEEICYSEEES